jgi:signal transduction histidine kinase/ActR/RegA family two-component response regulator
MNAGASESDAATVERRLLQVEILDLHARGLLRMPYIQALIVVGIGLFIVPSVTLWSFLVWSVAPVGAEVLRSLYARFVLRRQLELNPTRAHLIFIGLAGLSGATISAGAVLFFPQLPILHQALFGATLFALPAAGVAVSSSRYILSAYAVCVLLPASITWASLHPSQALALTALSAAYCVTIFFVSSDGEKLILRSVIIRHERDALVRNLEVRNAQVLEAVSRAERAAQAKARVLAAASHDLRQPLHALSLYSAVLAAEPNLETVQELSRNIDQIVRSLGSLLNGLLDLSRLSAAHYVPEREVLDVRLVLMQVCDEYQQAAQHKQLTLRRDLLELRMLGDPLALSRIVRNLVDNSIKYTDDGEVSVVNRIESVAGHAWLVITVSDSGRGIPPAEHERIFEEFYQLDNPGRDQGKGVGLGLAIVRRLCELSHGTIRLKSELGRGTSFEVRLPAQVLLPARSDELEQRASTPRWIEKRIYVVDDEVEIQRSMQKLLASWKAEVKVAGSTDESEQLLKLYGRPDLLIVDLRLNEAENGVELAERLLATHGRFPVLVVTGETSSDALVRARMLGYPVLRKPIAGEVLHRTIEDVIGTEQQAASDLFGKL